MNGPADTRKALAADLTAAVRGEVRFDEGSRALYATDASNYRQPPIGVVLPRDREDVTRALAVCRAHGAPVLPRGAGTSLAGQCCNVAVVLDLSRHMHRVRSIDVDRRLGVVDPGTVLDDLRTCANREGLTFGPDPATHNRCTLGGMVGNDSCGVHSVMARNAGHGARTADNIDSLEVATYDGAVFQVGATSESELDAIIRRGGPRGRIYERLRSLRDTYAHAIRTGFPRIPRRVSGYNLPYLLPENGFHVARALAGSEGTCATVLEITAHLIPNPIARVLLVLGYPDVFEAADDVPAVLAHAPIGLEGIDDRLVQDIRRTDRHRAAVRLLPEGAGWLLVEFGGTSKADAAERAEALMTELRRRARRPLMTLLRDDGEAQQIWDIRESALGATVRNARNRETWPGWEDSAVPPERLGEYLRQLRALLETFGYEGDLYGHFGQGCVHTRIDFDLTTAAGVVHYHRFVEQAADLVVRLGGSLSGEHGDGQARGELLPRMYSAEVMAAFREFKSIWDPDWKMNPGKVVRPARLDEHLRLGPGLHLPAPQTHFAYPDDGGSFARAVRRCVGVGACRRLDGGTMCPSYMVTREERHSTRGRARLLFEMLQGDPMAGGWQAEPVREALDLCLACKGCKGECPVHVDMATYKAEFLSHYYETHHRPRHAYAFGLVHYWARAASTAPTLANLAGMLPGIRRLVAFAAGMDAGCQIPAFAPRTFTEWFRRRSRGAVHDGSRPTVLLWPDTFNNHFHPETAIAAVHVLERAGFRVRIPRRPVCCGRPLYDYGLLVTARRWLESTLEALSPAIEAGIPIVGLEPSCVSVFRDELPSLLPGDARAQRLRRQTHLLSEFLHHLDGFAYPQLRRHAVVHGHCHHKAVLEFSAETAVLQRMGLDCAVLDSGCCGLAGSFGFERGHRSIAEQIGERVLAPAVRHARPDTLIVADGFSCREQIRRMAGRRALHLADLLDMAAREGPSGPSGDFPERDYVPDHSAKARALVVPAIIAAGLGAAVVAATTWRRAGPRE